TMLPPFWSRDPPATPLYPLSLHDALPICSPPGCSPRTWRWSAPAPHPRSAPAVLSTHVEVVRRVVRRRAPGARALHARGGGPTRSEEHTSELQSRDNLVCRLLLEKKKEHA